ncbi:uncharacterized protein LOC108913431 [Anoplophora glabripennis]|uniref:uncharacterized protein LOC108913431 n=1 Tax=Anoplophora glabripennis TaxID=217634 RepID=UPI0008743CD3|nr:uncharacterized protein LOC108913431 [Anoplophora glabripennis]
MSLETPSVANRRRGNQPGNHSTINDNHGSLQTKLRSLYEEETYFVTKKLEKYRIRKQKLLSQLAFLCRDTRRKLDQTERDLLEVHLRLTDKLDRETWDLVDKLTTEKASFKGEETKQKSKFQKLLKDQSPKQANWDLVDKLTTEKASFKGEETKQKSKFQKLLKDQSPKQANLNKSRTVINLASIQLDEDTTEVFTKGLNFAIAPKTIPKEEIISLLLDPIYKNIRNNTVKKVEKKVAVAVRSSNIPKELHRSLIQTDSRTPQLYCLPKIHKPNIPLRPIVSAVGSATHPLARYVAHEIRDLVGRTEYHVKNAGDFIDRIRGIELQPGDILVSFHVTSLFTKVPVDEALEKLHRRLIAEEKGESLMELAKVCIKSTFFAFRDQFYEQTKGAFEKKALKSTTLKPKCWYRYVDDTFIIWPHGRNTVADFLDHINGIHPDIQFTMEVEKNAALPFLDVLVERKPDDTLEHRVYRKPTHTDRDGGVDLPGIGKRVIRERNPLELNNAYEVTHRNIMDQ